MVVDEVALLWKAGSADISNVSEAVVPDLDILGSRETASPSLPVECDLMRFNRKVKSRESTDVALWSFIARFLIRMDCLLRPEMNRLS